LFQLFDCVRVEHKPLSTSAYRYFLTRNSSTLFWSTLRL
jgi:hypothetical protein